MTIPNNLPLDPQDSVFAEMKYFNEKMRHAYLEGELPKELTPYFNWKFGNTDIRSISTDTAYAMRNLTEELLDVYYDRYPEAFRNVELYRYDAEDYNMEESIWCQYKGFKEDKYVVSFLEKIDGELSEMLIGNVFIN